MKFKTTQKAIKNGYYHVIQASYCALQNLLQYEQEIAYTTRAEGWGADIYQFGNTAIVTGYAPFGDIRPSYEVNKRYNDKAKEIISKNPYDYQEKKTQLRELINQYIQEVTQ